MSNQCIVYDENYKQCSENNVSYICVKHMEILLTSNRQFKEFIRKDWEKIVQSTPSLRFKIDNTKLTN